MRGEIDDGAEQHGRHAAEAIQKCLLNSLAKERHTDGKAPNQNASRAE